MTGMPRRTYSAAVALATAGLLVAGGVYGLKTSEPLVAFPMSATEVVTSVPEGKARTDLDSCLTMQDTLNMLDCTKALLMRNITIGEYGTALGQLREAVQRNSDVMAGCHSYAHDMGKQVYAQGMPLAEIYKIGWNECRLGFPHGALQVAAADLGKDDIGQAFGNLCSTMGLFGEEAEGDCIHLIGHVIADLYGSDLLGGAAACKSAGSDYQWGRCIHGLLMRSSEHVIIAQSAGASNEEKVLAEQVWGTDRAKQIDVLEQLCNEVLPDSITPTCANSVPTVLSVLWNYEWASIHVACERFDGLPLDQCYQGIAGATVTSQGWDPATITKACEAGKGRLECYRSAGGVFGSTRPEGDPDKPLCGVLVGEARIVCREGYAEGAGLTNRLQTRNDQKAAPSDSAD
jgi:hypothetical protein